MNFHWVFRHSAWIVWGMFIITCEPATTAPTTGDIKGTILDAATSQPISGATVSTDPITSSKTTDSEGAYIIEGVDPETYTIQASKSGYTTNTTTVRVVAGETASADIQLSEIPPVLSVTPTTLDFATTITTLPLTISNDGEGQLDWTIAEGATWITVTPTSGSTTTEQSPVSVIVDRTGLDAGDYTESIIISSNAGSATITVAMSVQGPILIISNNSLNFGTTSTSLTFNVTNGGIGTLTYNAVYSANWISVTPASGSATTETDVISVTVDRTGLAYGNQYETITVTSNANSETVDILMTIPNPINPQLSAYPFSLDFGSNLEDQQINISNTGTGSLTWNITDDKNWISITPLSGTTETEIDAVTVSVARLGMSPGTYSGTIAISSDGGNQSVSVVMEVPNEPTLSVSPGVLDFGSQEIMLSFGVVNNGSGDLTWSVTDNQDWITTSPSSGTNYGSVNVSVSRDGLSTGDYSGTVTVSSNGGTGDVVVLMNVPADLPPTAVQLYEPTDIAANAMTLSWEMSAETDFLSYKLYRGSDATVNKSSTLVTTITNRYTVEYTDGSLQDGTTYYYKLYVEDIALNTTASNVVSGTTLSEPGVWGSFATMAVDLKWISALNSNFVYAVGDSGKIYKWDGSSWAEEQSPTTEWLGGVTIIAENDIWISGKEGVWHYNGALWVQEAGYPTTAWFGIDHVSADSVWVAGVGEIHFYNGTTWSASSVGSGSGIMDISMNSPSDGWAISSVGEVLHYNGFSWALVYDFNTYYSNTFSVWAVDGSNLWVVGEAISPPGIEYLNRVWHWDNSQWTHYSVPAIYYVEGTSATDVWFAGQDGHIYHWNGIEFSEMNSPTTENIWKIHFLNAGDGWAVGDGGVILRYH